MPNTIAHIGVQTILGRAIVPQAKMHWLLMACILPDLAWILQKLLRASPFDFNMIDIRTYAIAQSSLMFCLVLAAAFALLSRHRVPTFLILALGSVLHLLLDATQIKWGNGVVLFAPFEWTVLNFELYWPEQAPSYVLTAFSVVFVIFYLLREGPEPLQLNTTPMRWWFASALVLAVWLAGPIVFMDCVEEANLHNTQTLRDIDNRNGQQIMIDRNRVVTHSDGELHLQLWTGEQLRLTNPEGLPKSGVTSLEGTFVGSDAVSVQEIHLHHEHLRDWLSYLGLAFIACWLGVGAIKGRSSSRAT